MKSSVWEELIVSLFFFSLLFIPFIISVIISFIVGELGWVAPVVRQATAVGEKWTRALLYSGNMSLLFEVCL